MRFWTACLWHKYGNYDGDIPDDLAEKLIGLPPYAEYDYYLSVWRDAIVVIVQTILLPKLNYCVPTFTFSMGTFHNPIRVIDAMDDFDHTKIEPQFIDVDDDTIADIVRCLHEHPANVRQGGPISLSRIFGDKGDFHQIVTRKYS